MTTGSAAAGAGGIVLPRMRAARGEPHADVVVREDRRAGLAEVLVPARVVEVPVGVDEVAHRRAAEVGHRLGDLVGQRGELVVDQHGAVGAVGHADVAARAEQHRHPGPERLGLDLDFAEVGRLRRGGTGGERDCGGGGRSG